MADGVDVKTAQERMGHASAKVYLDMYAEFLQSEQDVALECVEKRMALT